MKRTVAFLLSLVMVLTLFGTIPAFAEGPATDADAIAAGYYFRIGETQQEGVYYKTWAELATAVNASTSSDPVQVTQLADYTVPAQQTLTHPIAYEGNNKTLSAGDFYLFSIQGAGNFTFQNATINAGFGFIIDWYSGASKATILTLKNITAHVSAGLFVNYKEGGAANVKNEVIIDGCTVDSIGGTAALIGYFAPARWTYFTIKDSTLTQANQFGSSGWDGTIFNINGKSSTQGTVVIDIQNSHITNARSITDTTQYWTTSMFRFVQGEKGTVKVDNKSVLEMSATSAGGTYMYVLNTSGTDYKFYDNGATYMVGTEMSKKGVTFPKVTHFNGNAVNNRTLFTDGTANYDIGSTFKNTGATAPSSFHLTVLDMNYAEMVEAGYVFRVGAAEDLNNLYSSLANAYAAASAGDTIYLLGNASVGAVLNFTKANVTLEGGGHRLNVTAGYAFVIKNTTTFRNVTLAFTKQGFSFNPTDDDQVLTLDGVTGTNGGGLFAAIGHTGRGMVNGKRASVLIKDSTIRGTGEELFLIQLDAYWTFTVQNSTLEYNGAGGGDKNHEMAIQLGGSLTQPVNLTIDGTSKIVSNCTQTAGAKPAVIWADSTLANRITLEKGAEIRVGNVGQAFQFIRATNAVITDKGANYVASAAALEKGVVLPTVSTLTGKDYVLGFSDGTGLYKAGSTVTEDGATEARTFAAVGFNNSDFNLTDGASIRTESYAGIRFTTNLSADLLALIDENATYGTYLVPTRFITAGSGPIVAGLEAGKYERIDGLSKPIDNPDGSRQYYSALVNFPVNATAYKTQISAQSYFTLTYADGETATFCTAYVAANNSRSLYQVATALKALPGYETTPFIESIIQTVTDAGLAD